MIVAKQINVQNLSKTYNFFYWNIMHDCKRIMFEFVFSSSNECLRNNSRFWLKCLIALRFIFSNMNFFFLFITFRISKQYLKMPVQCINVKLLSMYRFTCAFLPSFFVLISHKNCRWNDAYVTYLIDLMLHMCHLQIRWCAVCVICCQSDSFFVVIVCMCTFQFTIEYTEFVRIQTERSGGM